MRNVFDAFLTEQRDRFVLFLPVFMGAGILAYFARTTEPALSQSALALGVSGAGVAVAWRWRLLRTAWLCVTFAVAGFAVAGFATWRAAPWGALPRHAVVVSGRVRLVEALPEARRITVAAVSLDGAPAQARDVRIRLRATDATALAPGDQVQVRALLRPPAPPDYPGGRDPQREAYFAGLGGYGFAIGTAQRVRPARPGWFSGLRDRLAARIMAGLPGAAGAIAATLLTGIGTAIPPADRLAFQDSGLAHLLAVAGLHIGIVMGVVFASVRLGLAASEGSALYWPTRQVAAGAALAAGLFYLGLTGAHVPIVRSLAMAALAALGVLTGRRAVSLRGLALAATVLMVIAPDSVVGVSFQMSFAAVLVLIAGYAQLRPGLARLAEGAWWRRPARMAAGLAITSALAGTAALPFAAYHFGRAALFYVPANLVAVPLTALWVMPWGMAVLALMPFGLERLALAPMGWGIDGLIAIARAVAGWPWASVAVPQAPAWGLALVGSGLAWGGLWRGRLRLLGAVPLAVGLASPVIAGAPDLLVGPDAALIAARLGGQTMMERAPEATSFAAEAPLRVWGSTAAPFTTGPGIRCTRESCRAEIRGQAILLVRDAGGIDCRVAVIVSVAWLHDPCGATPVFDHAAVLRNGAVAIRLTPQGPCVVSDRLVRGNRPWVIGSQQSLPMAAAE